ncbi:PAS domain-containing protein [Pseudomonas stutzeri]|uniref:hybrid sensor histidine kinase/response regulator n=1 Tax=Stutzerimonas stutzeri TaxID=316 RepID=UPI0021089101|nr:PAS domain-containing protein [Stutzerimonas stutzeri]MCQ4286560.1 PAS domain-containing protein [Stutzerimonas stutzeri]
MPIDPGAWPAGRSEMSGRIRNHDWSATPLGAIDSWPVSLRVLLDTLLEAPLPMCVLWGDRDVQLYNDAHAALIGSCHPAALGAPVASTWAEIWPALTDTCSGGDRSQACLLRNYRLPDGDAQTGVWFDLALSPIRDDQQIAGRLLCLRHSEEEALRRSEAEIMTITDALPVLIGYVDQDERYRFNNRHYQSWFGQSPEWLYGKRLIEVVGERAYNERREQIKAALAGEPMVFEAYMPHQDGRPRHALMHYLPRRDAEGQVQGFFVLCQDVTERWQAEQALRELNETLESRVQERTTALAEVYERLLKEMVSREQAQEALRQAQKMEAVGQLTGGIAHDFNNMLTGIIGGLDLIQRYNQTGRHAETQRFIDAAATSANRAAALTHRLLAFARRQPLNLKRVDLNAMVESMRDLIVRTLGGHILVDAQLQPDLWAANSDENQLESALLNLVINARDAMPDGGSLYIATTNVQLSSQSQVGELAPGRYVTLSVIDSGCGMTPKVLAAAFEPFFTTKPIGQGTGLGLSMIYGFARQAGGHVQIRSEPGKGTEVTLYFPAHHALTVPAAAISSLTEQPPPATQGETVLVVEDDPAVRQLVLDVLGMLGYRALEAVEANAAIELLESGERIDLLVSDVGLPGMNGRQLADIARQHRPGLSVLFMTGYAEQAASSGFLEAGMDMISKPFQIDHLAARVRGMLARGG